MTGLTRLFDINLLGCTMSTIGEVVFKQYPESPLFIRGFGILVQMFMQHLIFISGFVHIF